MRTDLRVALQTMPFSLTVSLYLSPTQIIIAMRNEDTYTRLFYCQVRKMHAQSTCRPPLSRCVDRHLSMCIFVDAATLYNDNIKKTDVFSRLHSR